MMEKADGSGYFREVTLRPLVTITDAALVEKARSLHHEANRYCFIASSMKFPVHHQPEFKVVQAKAV
jgi:organic hydroperoxide reductase OsmC/OhrA